MAKLTAPQQVNDSRNLDHGLTHPYSTTHHQRVTIPICFSEDITHLQLLGQLSNDVNCEDDGMLGKLNRKALGKDGSGIFCCQASNDSVEEE